MVREAAWAPRPPAHPQSREPTASPSPCLQPYTTTCSCSHSLIHGVGVGAPCSPSPAGQSSGKYPSSLPHLGSSDLSSLRPSLPGLLQLLPTTQSGGHPSTQQSPPRQVTFQTGLSQPSLLHLHRSNTLLESPSGSVPLWWLFLPPGVPVPSTSQQTPTSLSLSVTSSRKPSRHLPPPLL